MAVNRKFYCLNLKHEYRGVAQLVERVVWDHQAAGSSPVTPNSPSVLTAFEKVATSQMLNTQKFILF